MDGAAQKHLGILQKLLLRIADVVVLAAGGAAAAQGVVFREQLPQGGHGFIAGVDERNVRPAQLGEDAGQQRIVRAAQDEGVDILLEQGGDVFLHQQLGDGAALRKAPVLHQGDKQGAGL